MVQIILTIFTGYFFRLSTQARFYNFIQVHIFIQSIKFYSFTSMLQFYNFIIMPVLCVCVDVSCSYLFYEFNV